jgi:hypothetical protein
MGKVLVALDDQSSFVKDMITTSQELFSNWKNNLYVGLLVKDLSYVTKISGFIDKVGLADYNPFDDDVLLSEEDQKKAELIANFIKPSKLLGLKHEIHYDFRMTAYEVVQQSMYADLLILSYQVFYNNIKQRADNSLLYYILKESKCPVLILPENINGIDNIVFTYDGKESSVFAIKAFSNLFSQATRDKITSILTIMPSLDEEIKNEKCLLDLVKQHFNNVGVQLLEGTSVAHEIIRFVESVENPLVVMGAYGRSAISNLLIPSVARNIIERRNLPLFIAHR